MLSVTEEGKTKKKNEDNGPGLAEILGKRVHSSHKPGPKPSSSPQVLSRTAERLIRRILKQSSDEDPQWGESNENVARKLGVDRSTVVRTVSRLRKAGILTPVSTKGGRGRVSIYRVNRHLAEAVLRQGRWPDPRTKGCTKQVQETVHKPMSQAKPEQEMPRYGTANFALSALLQLARSPTGQGPDASVDPRRYSLRDMSEFGAYWQGPWDWGPNFQDGLIDRLLSWWDRQPVEIRKGIKASAAEGILVLVGGLLGGWKGALAAGLVGIPIVLALLRVPGTSAAQDNVNRPDLQMSGPCAPSSFETLVEKIAQAAC